MKRQTSQLLTAPAGTGKSYMVTRDVVKEFLPNSKGKIYTNMPFGLVPESHKFPPEYDGETFVDRMADYVDDQSVRDRIELFDHDTLQDWKTDSGPWDYFEGVDITGAWIILDEAHNFCGRHHNSKHKQKWQQFCGELRHQGASIQFVTQSPVKLAKEIINECGLRQALVDAEEERDPFLKIKMAYWYELRAKLTGKYRSCFVRIDLRDIDGKKTKRDHLVRVARLQEIFRLYDSFAAPHAGGNAASSMDQREYEKRNWPSLLWWFFRSNFGQFLKPVFFVSFIISIMIYGGQIMAWFTTFIASQATPNVPQSSKPKTFSPVVQQQAQPQTQDVAADQENVIEAIPERLELRVLTPSHATFSDGVVLRPGETMEAGEYEGEIITRIDWPSRSVELGNGERIRLGRLRFGTRRPQPEDGGTVDTALPSRTAQGSGSSGRSRR